MASALQEAPLQHTNNFLQQTLIVCSPRAESKAVHERQVLALFKLTFQGRVKLCKEMKICKYDKNKSY